MRKRTHQARNEEGTQSSEESKPDATRLSRRFLAAGARSPIFAPALPRRRDERAVRRMHGAVTVHWPMCRMSESGPVNRVGTGKNHRPEGLRDRRPHSLQAKRYGFKSGQFSL